MEVGVLARHLVGFRFGEEFDALVGLEVILHPEFVAGGVDPHIGMADSRSCSARSAAGRGHPSAM